MTGTEKSEAANFTASALGINRLKPGALQVTVGANVTKKHLYEIIDQITRQHGCLACGLGGLDIVIRPQDPRIMEGFLNIPEVKDVVIFR